MNLRKNGKVGNLVYHSSNTDFLDSYEYGIVVESWINQKKFKGIPEHDEDQIVVYFSSGLRIVNINEVRFI